jgi:hypothetical protein
VRSITPPAASGRRSKLPAPRADPLARRLGPCPRTSAPEPLFAPTCDLYPLRLQPPTLEVGQRGRASPALIRADAPDPRAALEAVVGPVDWFEMDEPVQAEAPPVNGGIPPIAADPPEPSAQAPPAADPVEDLDQQQRIVASAGRLADLSARLDAARPPHRWGDFTDVRREQD